MPENDGLIYGLTDTGFVTPPFLAVRQWVVRKVQKAFGKNARTDPSTRLGAVIDWIAWAVTIGFQGAEGAFNAAFFGTAKGISLDKSMELFAFPRLGATKSTAELVVWGDLSTVIAAGKQAQVEDTQKVFETDAEVTISVKAVVFEVTKVANPGDNWQIEVNGDVYNYVQLVDDDTEKVAKGLFAAIGDQANYTASYLGQLADHASDALVVDSKGPDLLPIFSKPAAGEGAPYWATRVASTCIEEGPVAGFATTINKIVTTTVGWRAVINQLDALVGRAVETDEEFRARWDVERFGPGKGTKKAMLAAFNATADLREKVIAIRVDEIPMVSFTVTICAPDLTDNEIAQIIWDTKPLGAPTAGADSGTAVDEEGVDHTVNFERAEVFYVWQKITITKGEKFPSLGDPASAIAKEVAVWGSGGLSPNVPNLAYPGLKMGDDLERFQEALAINAAIKGIKGATIRTALDASPNVEPPDPNFLDADVIVDADQALAFDSARIIVTISP